MLPQWHRVPGGRWKQNWCDFLTNEKQNSGGGEPGPSLIFAFMNEIGIISQLSTALFARTLPDGIHPSHFSVLNHLTRMGDGKTPVRIASAMQVTKATMTHTLKVLEDRGLIKVAPNPEDARGKVVFLTEAGRAFRNTAIEQLMARFAPLATEEHIEMMQRLLPELAAFRKYLDDNRQA